MNTTNNFNITSNLNILTNKNVFTNYSAGSGLYHTRSNSTNRPLKLTNYILKKETDHYVQSGNNYIDYLEIARKEKLKKLANVGKADIKETKYDLVISFEDKPLPNQKNARIYNKVSDREREKDFVNKSSFEFPSLISNGSGGKSNKSVKIGDFIGSENTSFPIIENYPAIEVKLRDKIKNNLETNFACSLEISNSMKLIDKKFEDLQFMQESELIKNRIGVDEIVREENEEEDKSEIDFESKPKDFVTNIYNKIKQQHLNNNPRFRRISMEVSKHKAIIDKNGEEYKEDYAKLWRMQSRASYETWLSHNNPTMEINQKINQVNLIDDIRYLNILNDNNKAEFIKSNLGKNATLGKKKRVRRSIFDLI